MAGSLTADGVDLTVDDGDDLRQRQTDCRQTEYTHTHKVLVVLMTTKTKNEHNAYAEKKKKKSVKQLTYQVQSWGRSHPEVGGRTRPGCREAERSLGSNRRSGQC